MNFYTKIKREEISNTYSFQYLQTSGMRSWEVLDLRNYHEFTQYLDRYGKYKMPSMRMTFTKTKNRWALAASVKRKIHRNRHHWSRETGHDNNMIVFKRYVVFTLTMTWILIFPFWVKLKLKDIIIYIESVVHIWRVLVLPNGLAHFVSKI